VERNTAGASSDRFTILLFRVREPIHPNSNSQLLLAAVRTKYDIFRPMLAHGAGVINGISVKTSVSVVIRKNSAQGVKKCPRILSSRREEGCR
jgi:hypothetical protein